MALAADDGLIGVTMTQAVRHIIVMVWGTGLGLGCLSCIVRALRAASNETVASSALNNDGLSALLTHIGWRAKPGEGLMPPANTNPRLKELLTALGCPDDIAPWPSLRC